MKYFDPEHKNVFLEQSEVFWEDAASNCVCPVDLFVERGGNLDDVEPWAPNISAMADEAVSFVVAERDAALSRNAAYMVFIDTEYQVLAQQADAYALAGYPENPEGLDMLVGSAEDSGKSVREEADRIRALRDQYMALLNVTRRLRRQAESAINTAKNAGDAAGINAARDQYVAEINAL